MTPSRLLRVVDDFCEVKMHLRAHASFRLNLALITLISSASLKTWIYLLLYCIKFN